jgi:hypothetical protein
LVDGYGEHDGTAYGCLKDLFWSGGRCEFGPANAGGKSCRI